MTHEQLKKPRSRATLSRAPARKGLRPVKTLSDAEVKAGMAAAGVDLDTLDEFLNDKVPTEFDLDPSELRENDSDIDGICY